MRSLLVGLAASLSIVTLHQPADACGPYEMPPPAVFAVSTHLSRATDADPVGSRTFVVLGGQAPKDTAWRPIAPLTFDYTSIADAPDAPTQLTLVGPAGTRVVTSRDRVFLKTSSFSESTTAVELRNVRRGDFAIALAGNEVDAKWRSLGDARLAGAAELAWLKQLGAKVEDPKLVYVAPVKGTQLEMIRVHAKDGATRSFVRSGKNLLVELTHHVHGVVQIRGERYVIHSSPRTGWMYAARIRG